MGLPYSSAKMILFPAFTAFLLSIFLFTGSAHAQEEQVWATRFNGTGSAADIANAIALDEAGGVLYVTGQSYGASNDLTLIKYNTAGSQVCIATYDNGGDDSGVDIALDSSGNIYVTGYTHETATSYDYVTIKYNSSCAQQWAQRYNSPTQVNDQATALVVDASGNVYVTGKTGTVSDFTTIKYDTNGVQQWAVSYNFAAIDQAKDIAVDASGNVYVTGTSYRGGATGFDYATVKYNSGGAQQWISTYNGPGNGSDQANVIGLDGSGNIYVTGNSPDVGADSDYATIRYDSNGVQQWVTRYDNAGGTDNALAMAVDTAGNTHITGQSNTDYIGTVKYNSSGVQQWVQNYNATPGLADHSSGNAIVLDSTGNVYVTGYAYMTFSQNYVTLKYNSGGNQQWAFSYDVDVATDIASSIVVDSTGNAYVTGRSTSAAPVSLDFATIKYGLPAGYVPPTLVRLSDFVVIPGVRQVAIQWSTGAEIDHMGFHVLRSSSPDGPFARVNESMIPARGIPPQGARYQYVDYTVHDGGTYYYRIEDVDYRGRRTAHYSISTTLDLAKIRRTPEGHAPLPVTATLTDSRPASGLSQTALSAVSGVSEGLFHLSREISEPYSEREVAPHVAGSDLFLQALSGDRQITLSWPASPDLQYDLFRSGTEDGEYRQINPLPLTVSEEGELTYTDRTVQNGVTYYYLLEQISPEGAHILLGPIPASPQLLLSRTTD